MAYIKVDHSKLESTATAIDDYVAVLENQMKGVQSEVATLSSSWQGPDFEQFKSQLDKVDDEDSVHANMINALESYAKYLRFAANKYKEAQTHAVNRANDLPKH